MILLGTYCFQVLVLTGYQANLDSQTPEEIDGVGGEEQKRVRAFVVSAVGPRD